MANPYFVFYTNDWIPATRCLSPAARGIWCDLLNFMMYEDKTYAIERSLSAFAFMCSATVFVMFQAVMELHINGVADIEFDPPLDDEFWNQFDASVPDQADVLQWLERVNSEASYGKIRVISRRRLKEEKVREYDRLRKKPGKGSGKIPVEFPESSGVFPGKGKGKGSGSGSVVAKQIPDQIPYARVVDHLNLRTGKHYKSTGEHTRKLIKARWGEGFTLEDFVQVIDNQVVKWGRDPKMQEFLRPETLFSNKFESYLNARPNAAQAGLMSPGSAAMEGWEDRTTVGEE